MKKIMISILVLFLFGCAVIPMPGVPGYIYESTSKFDGTKQLSMDPAWIDGGAFKMGLSNTTRMTRNEALLTIEVHGLHSFASGKSLHFNINGNFVSLASTGKTDYKTTEGHSSRYGYFPARNWSLQKYWVTVDFLKKIIDAESVVIRVDLEREYVEGVFSKEGQTTARPAFRDFCSRLATFR